jgi:acyl-CoA synthetase (AMP-forming)/AMP-acid ligase II
VRRVLRDRPGQDVIKSGGEWISSVELENHLMAHPKVKEASVVGVPDERWGERPLAVVVADGETLDVDELRASPTGSRSGSRRALGVHPRVPRPAWASSTRR